MPATRPARRVEDLSYLLAHTSHVLATQMSAAMASIGITPRAYCVLFHAMQAERTQIQLAEIADLDKTTMVVTVDELERAGLAERRPSGTGRRARIIAVTDAGRKAVAEGTRIADGVHRAVLDALPGPSGMYWSARSARLAAGYLAVPAGSGRPVRRARQRSTAPGHRPATSAVHRGCRGAHNAPRRADQMHRAQASSSSTNEYGGQGPFTSARTPYSPLASVCATAVNSTARSAGSR